MTVPAQAAESTPPAQTTEGNPGQTGANAQETSASPTPDSGSQHQRQDSRGPDYFREAFSRVRSYTPAPKNPDPAPQAPPDGGRAGRDPERDSKSRSGTASSAQSGAGSSTAASTRIGSPGQQAVVLTPEELQRKVQSEADRLLAKRQSDERAQRERDEERELRQTNPFEYARRMEEKEQKALETQKEAEKAVDLLSQQLTLYDRNILDPIVGALSDTTRKKVLESVQGEGISGREKIAKASLQALRQQWVAEGRDTARTSLMKDPSFIKEVLARHGGQREEPEASPASPPAGAARPKTSNESVNSWMRGASQATRYQPA